jgi:hypothetical protein
MHDSVTIMRERQLAVRRQMDRRGIALKVVQADSGICTSTLLSYFPAGGQPAVIPMSAVFQLIDGKALPLDLLSMLLPSGAALIAVPEAADHDAIDEAMRAYLADKARAHHPDSPQGREIAPCEDAGLRAKLAAVVK